MSFADRPGQGWVGGDPDPYGEAEYLETRRPRRRGRRRTTRRRLLVTAAVLVVLLGSGAVGGALLYRGVGTPELAQLPQRSTVFYADATTVMGYAGTVHRRSLAYSQLNPLVARAAVAAVDPDFWTETGSPIARRVARGLDREFDGSGPVSRLGAYVAARKLEEKYSKEQVLEYYLNLVPFGRDTFGIEAAALAYFGRSAQNSAPADKGVSPAQVIALVAMIDQPDPDPTSSQAATVKAHARWVAVRDAMVTAGTIDRADPAATSYPTDFVSAKDAEPQPSDLIVAHVLAEVRAMPAFQGRSEQLLSGGLDIVSTIEPKAQAAVEAAANPGSPRSVLRGQPESLAAAAVMIQPGTGRVLAYYGNSRGGGADFAGWYYDVDGVATGYGMHPAGQTFHVYSMAAALTQGISLSSRWASPKGTKAFPAAGRVAGSAGGLVTETGSSPCQPRCTLADASQGSLVIPFFDLALHVGVANIQQSARDAGISYMWDGRGVRHDLRTANIAAELVPKYFDAGLGVGEYAVTVLDQANAMATFASRGQRAQAHFVALVRLGLLTVASESGASQLAGLSGGQLADLTWALSRNPTGRLTGIDSATKVGTWAASGEPGSTAHAWMIGYTSDLALAVWLGSKRGDVPTGLSAPQALAIPAAIYRSAMTDVHFALGLHPARFPKPANTGSIDVPGSI